MIRFAGVDLTLGERKVLTGIDLELSERRIGVVGANGSGKSSLARLINGLHRPTRGRVSVDGLDTFRDASAVRRKVGFLFSDADHQIVMPTVAEDLAFSLRGRDLSRDETERRVQTVASVHGLADHLDHPCHLLSSGQKQMLALAAVLVLEPSVIVADEPTTLLDRANVRLVRDRLAALEQQLILVTHHLETLEDADRVLVVDGGRVVVDDVPALALPAYRRLVDGR